MRNTDQEPREEHRGERDTLDLILDAALAKYAAVEPRAGLEQRILAHLRAESARLPHRSWWQWSAAVAVALLLAFVLVLAWRSNRAARLAVHHPPAPVEIVQPSPTQFPVNGDIHATTALRQTHKAARHHVHQPSAIADGPKLDQFPSPEPLTKEELALVRYIRQFPSDAVMVASAQAEFEKEIQQEAAAGQQATSNSREEER